MRVSVRVGKNSRMSVGPVGLIFVGLGWLLIGTFVVLAVVGTVVGATIVAGVQALAKKISS